MQQTALNIYKKRLRTVDDCQDREYPIINNCSQINIDFRIKNIPTDLSGEIRLIRGQITALIGRSGTGKTSILKSFIENENQENHISIRCADNQKHLKINRHTFGNSAALVPQDCKLITGSFSDNLLLRPHSESEMDNCESVDPTIISACLLDDIAKDLEDNVVSNESGERGLSGGQVQRIVIARALIPTHKIYCLMSDWCVR